MGLAVQYEPPARNLAALLHAAGELGVEAAGKVLLSASQPLVPVDTGELKASGKAEITAPLTVTVSYSRTGEDGYNVAARQHEDMTLHHAVGQAKYLEQPLHAEDTGMLAAMVEPLRAVL